MAERIYKGHVIVEVEVSYTKIKDGADHSDPEDDGVMTSFIQVAVPQGLDVDKYAKEAALAEAEEAGWLDAWVENICDLDEESPINSLDNL